MKKKWSLVVAVIVIILLVGAIIGTAMFKKSGNEGTEKPNQGGENVNSPIAIESVNVGINGEANESGEKTTYKLGEFTVEDLNLEYKDDYTFVQGNIINETETDYPVGVALEVTLYKGDVEIFSFPVLTSSLRKGETSTFETQLTEDFSAATDAKITLRGE